MDAGMTTPISIPSTPSLATGHDALASAATMPNGGTRPPDAFQDARTGKTCPEATFHPRRLHRYAALTGFPGGPLPVLASQPGGAAGEPAPDFAQLMMPPGAPAGDAADTAAAMPASPPQPTPGSSTRLKLTTGGSDGAAPLTREQIEAVAAMLAPLWQMVSNLAPEPITSAPTPSAGFVAHPPGEGAEAGPIAVSTSGPAPSFTLHVDEHPVPGFEAAVALPGNDLSALTGKLGAALAQPAASQPPMPTEPVPALAMQPTGPANIPASTAGDSVSLQFELPDGRMVRAEAAVTAPVTLPQADLRNRTKARIIAGVAKNAASPVSPGNSAPAADLSANKNFLSVEGSDDGVQGAGVGIPVAQSRSAMAAPSSERPTADELIVQAFAPENRSASAAPLADIREHRPSTIAQRAVEAVVEVVEAQAATRLQPAPGVQLHLKLGGEDIAIRVELREGNVHTQFRTDSPEVRQAIAQEWSLLRTESPERTLRYLEPEFPADRPGSAPGGSGQHGAASHQQSRPPQPEIFGAVGRSYPYSRTEADSPVLEIAARMLPTSVHLSAVA
jgi:hypothetical protein